MPGDIVGAPNGRVKRMLAGGQRVGGSYTVSRFDGSTVLLIARTPLRNTHTLPSERVFRWLHSSCLSRGPEPRCDWCVSLTQRWLCGASTIVWGL